ncbi:MULTISPECIES: hypothetical protein, partial [Halomonadaceae]|uniref:hypothetical protein n=1 Tax=Halomonadaceae TaxID=28256 RepID=UPI001C2E12F2
STRSALNSPLVHPVIYGEQQQQGLTFTADSVEYAFLAGRRPNGQADARCSTLQEPELLFNNRSDNSCGRLSMKG